MSLDCVATSPVVPNLEHVGIYDHHGHFRSPDVSKKPVGGTQNRRPSKVDRSSDGTTQYECCHIVKRLIKCPHTRHIIGCHTRYFHSMIMSSNFKPSSRYNASTFHKQHSSKCNNVDDNDFNPFRRMAMISIVPEPRKMTSLVRRRKVWTETGHPEFVGIAVLQSKLTHASLRPFQIQSLSPHFNSLSGPSPLQ